MYAGSSANVTYVQTRDQPERMVAIAVVILQLILSIVGNIGVCYVIVKDPNLRKLPMIPIFHLSVADIGFTCFSIISTLTVLFEDRWMLGGPTCVAFGCLIVVFAAACIQHMLVIAFSRLLYVRHPTLAKSFLTKKFYFGVAAFVWIWTFSFGFFPALGWGDIIFNYGMTLCINDWPVTSSYTIITISTNYVIPATMIVVMYAMIFFAVGKSGRRVGNAEDASVQNRIRRTDVKLAKMSFAIFCSLILCWVPLVTMTFFELAEIYVSPRTTLIGALILYCNSISNPIVYALMSNDFRTAFRNVLKRRESTAIKISVTGTSE